MPERARCADDPRTVIIGVMMTPHVASRPAVLALPASARLRRIPGTRATGTGWRAAVGLVTAAIACAFQASALAASRGKATVKSPPASTADGVAFERRARTDLASLVGALRAYRRDHGSWPAGDPAPALASTYLKSVPRLDPWGTAYAIEATGETVTVTSAGPDRTRGTADDITQVAVPEARSRAEARRRASTDQPERSEAVARADVHPATPQERVAAAPASAAPAEQPKTPVAAVEAAASEAPPSVRPDPTTPTQAPSSVDRPAAPKEGAAPGLDEMRTAMSTLRGLADALESHRRREGHYPATPGVDALGQALVADVGRAGWSPADPWGKAWQYTPTHGGASYTLVSAGADGQLDAATTRLGAVPDPASDIVVSDGRFVRWPEAATVFMTATAAVPPVVRSADDPAARDETARALEGLAEMLEEYRGKHGRYPEGDDAARVIATDLKSRASSRDAWGHRLSYISAHGGATYALVSAGPDGRLDRPMEARVHGRADASGDDIIVRDGQIQP